MSATRYLALLRAVNVGKRRVAMADLRADLEALGLDDVSTYINSGNGLFTSTKAARTLEPKIEQVLEDRHGFVVETFVRSAAQIRRAVDLDPFDAVPADHTHLVAFLRAAPSKAEAGAIEAMATDADDLVVDGAEVHWHISGKSLDTLLKPKDWKAAGAGLNTTRNITMLRKVLPKLEG